MGLYGEMNRALEKRWLRNEHTYYSVQSRLEELRAGRRPDEEVSEEETLLAELVEEDL